jgi:hypothetical protein
MGSMNRRTTIMVMLVSLWMLLDAASVYARPAPPA